MSARSEPRKDELIDRIAALARARLGAKSGAAETFLRRFYANVAVEDLAASPVEDLYGAAIALWQFGKTRAPGQAKVRVYTPRLAEHGWASTHSVVEIVNDDMPFLVDSVIAELNRRELSVHLVIHPIVRVVRDAKGVAQDIAPTAPGRGRRVLYACRDRPAGLAGAADRHRARLDAVLADVRVSVADWKAMVARAAASASPSSPNGRRRPRRRDGGRGEFLSWLADDHFTFLGYREYAFTGEGDSARTSVVADSGLGLPRRRLRHLRGAARPRSAAARRARRSYASRAC